MRRATSAMTNKPRRSAFRPALEVLEDRLAPAILPTDFSETAIATGLTSATAMELSPDGKLFITEQAGTMEVWQNSARLQANFFANTPFAAYNSGSDTGLLDPRGERGLLGVAFDPAFASNRHVFVYYTAAVNADGNTSTPTTLRNRVSRFTANAAGDLALAGTEQVILELDNLSATNHNGGALHFGPDGKLYVAVGDNANGNNAPSLSTRHGKILRINNDGSIPEDNPFFTTATGVNRSIWALGLRNPFTFTFQPGTGKMHINDVGEGSWEEINVGAAGANYGWPATEGDFNQASHPTYTRPLYAYAHGGGTFEGFAITGGAFYDPASPGANRFPTTFTGDYFFADFVNDWINVRDAGTGTVTRFATDALGTVDLRVAADGALLYLARGQGKVSRVIYTPPIAPPAVQIIDNGDAGYSTTGNWETFPNVGHAGDFGYSPSGTGADVASWTFAVTPGQYRVSATWVARPNRATNAPYTILDGAASLGTFRVDQRQEANDFSAVGSPWENLATVSITGNGLVVSLSDDANSDFVIADAIRIERIGDLIQGPEAQVLDGSTDIADGTGSVNFGSAAVGAPVSKTFTVRNQGTETLTLGAAISVPAGFTLTSGFGSTSLAPGESTTFIVRLDAAAVGTYSGEVSFTSNDANESPFNFAISGTVAVPSATQIIDNGDAGFSTVGNWETFPNVGHGGDFGYSPSGTGADVASWTFAVTPGQYRVSATWVARPNRATNAPFTILDGAASLGTVRVDQRQEANDFTAAGSAWENLATVTITGNTLNVRLSDDANSDYVIADAIRIERLPDAPSPPAIQIIDNGDAGYSTTGNWETFPNVGHGGDFGYSPSGTGADVASWAFTVTPGQYRVSATWVARPNRATNAPFTILDGAASLGTVRVDQRQEANDFAAAGSPWEDLATVTITGNSLTVRLSDDANSDYVIADAIRIERIG